jgi:hypothetical protein
MMSRMLQGGQHTIHAQTRPQHHAPDMKMLLLVLT